MNPKTPNLATILAVAPVFVELYDRDGHLLWTNRHAYGFTAAGSIGQQGDDRVYPDDLPAWQHARSRCVDLHEIVAGTVRLVTPALREPVKLAYRMAPVIEGALVTGYVVTSQDTTYQASADIAAPFLLNPLEKSVVAELLKMGALKGAAIGKRIDEVIGAGQASQRLRHALAGLIARGILVHNPFGYAVSPEFLPLAQQLVK